MTVGLLAHRGLWRTPDDQNSLDALTEAIRHGWGIETDVRDQNGVPVISHDPATGQTLSLGAFLENYSQLQSDKPLALNIKSCGLAARLRNVLDEFEVANYFVFDMSIPDTMAYRDLGMPFYARQSEIEPQPSFYESCAGIWLDSFHGDWFQAQTIADHLAANKPVCVVSPELHARPFEHVWHVLQRFSSTTDQVLLCTDHPQRF